jgi:hypothetical protein
MANRRKRGARLAWEAMIRGSPARIATRSVAGVENLDRPFLSAAPLIDSDNIVT